MYNFKDSGFGNIWLLNGYETGTDKFGSYFSIDDIPGLYRAIAIALAHGGGSMCSAELRLMRQQLNMTQKQLAAKIGRTEQTVLLWERRASKTKEAARASAIPEDSARLIKLMVLATLCKEITLPAAFCHLEQAAQDQIVLKRTNGRWDSAINGSRPVVLYHISEWDNQDAPPVSFVGGQQLVKFTRAYEVAISGVGASQWKS